MSTRLAGKVVLITGGGSGVGAAIAQVAHEEGALVGVLDIDTDRAHATAQSIDPTGNRVLAVSADVSQSNQVVQAVDLVVKRYGRLDALFSNAAVQIMGPLHQYEEADFDRTIAVNLKGTFLTCRYALPLMMKQRSGVIVVTSSVLGLVGDPDLSVYGATKGGLIALIKSLAVCYGPFGIRALAVCPGDVNTPMLREFFDFQKDPAASRAEVHGHYPLKRIAEPSEVARVCAFLASDEASFVSGTELVVDGGLLANVY